MPRYGLRRIAGVGLVELMIAMALAMVLMLGIIQVYIPSLKTNDVNRGVSQVQEKARYLTQILAKDIRMAGYSGCMTRADIEVDNVLNHAGSAAWEYENDLYSILVNGTLPTGGAGIPNLNSLLASDATPTDGNSLLLFSSAIGDAISLLPPKQGANLTVSDNGDTSRACSGGGNSIGGFCIGDIVMLADCSKAKIFQATNVNIVASNVRIEHAASGTPGNSTTSWGDNTGDLYSGDSELIRKTTLTYFVANNVDGVSSLFRKSDNDTALELASNVYSFRTLYGVDTVGQKQVTVYQDEASVSNWDDVISVRIELLIGSDETGLLDEPQRFSLNFGNQAEAAMADTRYYQMVRSTVVLRNRTF
ncbi:PilW family protein [Alginatibacterium sediminis]|uniref:PilW family protein n=1 Tax=Alginatibacterium sediminis TaxID=2164068 RepID=UPI0013147784|nr:PilW family protein [Alginatibacterium sediminis]